MPSETNGKRKCVRRKDPYQVSTDLTPAQILTHVTNPSAAYNYKAFFEDDDQYPFIKLLEIINMRAADLSEKQNTFPRMDLTALYCLGITIQEYARYLNTDLVTQKRQLENKPALHTFLSPEEINEQSAAALIEKYKTKPTIQPKSTSVHVVPRPNLEDDLNYVEKTKRARTRHQVEVKTSNKETDDDKMMNNPEWKGTLRANKRTLEAESIAAKQRRAEAEKEKKRIAADRKQKQLERQQQLEQERQRQLENIPPPLPPKKQQAKRTRTVKQEPVDMFDLSSQKSSQKPAPKKRKTASKKKASSSGF